MIRIKTAKHIPTSRTIASFRSCPSLRRLSYRLGDRARMMAETGQLANRLVYRIWVNRQG